MMDELGIKKKFQLNKNAEEEIKFDETSFQSPFPVTYGNFGSNYNQLQQEDGEEFTSRAETRFSYLAPITGTNDVPYIESIQAIERIHTCTTPREKLHCLSEAFSGLKTAVVDFHKGKMELDSMDDVLPLTIYVISQVELPFIAAQFNMLEDFLKIND